MKLKVASSKKESMCYHQMKISGCLCVKSSGVAEISVRLFFRPSRDAARATRTSSAFCLHSELKGLRGGQNYRQRPFTRGPPEIGQLPGGIYQNRWALLAAYEGRIVIFASLLHPRLPGAHGIEDAECWGGYLKAYGVTIHWVDSGVDTGEGHQK